MKKKFLIPVVLFAILMIIQIDVEAQCSMCKAVLETNMQSGGDAVGRGINKGIIYIMFVPYALMAIVGFMVYRHYKKTHAE